MPTTQTQQMSEDPRFLRFEAIIAWRLILVIAAALLSVWLVLQITVIAVAAFVGFAQAALLWPAVQWLQRYLPRVLAAIICVGVFAAVVLLLGFFIITQMINAWPQFYDAVVGSLRAANDWVVAQGWTFSTDLTANLEEELVTRLGTLASGLGGVAMTVAGILGGIASIVLVALFSTLFALIGGEKMTQGIVGFMPAGRQLSTFAAIRDATTTARWWVIASAVTGAVDGIFIGLGLAVLGVPLAVPLGVVTFILAFIPMIGATVAGALAVAIALFFGGVPTALWTLLLVLAVQQIEGNLLSPLLLSRAMNFPPLITLLISTGAGVALGLPGLFLAVPAAGVIVAAVRAWRRELPEDVRAAREIGVNPSPTFDQLVERVSARPQAAETGDDTGDDAGEERAGDAGEERAGGAGEERAGGTGDGTGDEPETGTRNSATATR